MTYVFIILHYFSSSGRILSKGCVKMEKIEKLKKYILPAIPAFVLTFVFSKVLNPVLEILYSSFLKLGSFFIKSFSDSTYKTISHGYSELPSLWNLYFLTIILMMILFVFYMLREFQFDKFLDSIRELKTKNNDCIKKITSATETNSISDEDENINDILSELIETKNDLDNFEMNVNNSHKKRSFILKLVTAILLFIMIFLYAQQSFINTAITKALSNIEIVSPYISESEYRHLKSDFYSINNHEDYDLLFHTLEEIADANSINLKK